MDELQQGLTALLTFVAIVLVVVITLALFGLRSPNPSRRRLSQFAIGIVAFALLIDITNWLSQRHDAKQARAILQDLHAARSPDGPPPIRGLHIDRFWAGELTLRQCSNCGRFDTFLFQPGQFIEFGENPVTRVTLLQGSRLCGRGSTSYTRLPQLSKYRARLADAGVCLHFREVSAISASHSISTHPAELPSPFSKVGHRLDLVDRQTGEVVDRLYSVHTKRPSPYILTLGLGRPTAAAGRSFSDYTTGPLPALFPTGAARQARINHFLSTLPD